MIKTLEYYIRKPGYYLSLLLKDSLVGLFIVILAFKLAFFTYITGHAIETFFSSFGIIMAVVAFSLYIGSNKVRFCYLYTVDILFSMLFFAHALYFSYFSDFASIYHLKIIHQLGDVSDAVMNMIGKELLFVVDLIFLPFLLFRIKQLCNNIIPERHKVFGFMVLLCLLFNISPVIYHARFAHNYFKSIYNRDDFVRNMGFIAYQVTDIYYFFMTENRRVRITSSDIESVKEWKRQNKVGGENEITGIGKGMNLIIIQVESLQNFVIGKSYNDREITPNLNRLAKEGIYFNNIYDQTAAGNSSDATLLVNSSLYPSRKGPASFLYAQNHFDSLPDVLAEHGYTTAVMEAYKKHFWNNAAFDRSLGFQRQFYEDDYLITDTIGWQLKGLSDKAFFAQSIKKIKEMHTPFYALLRTLSTHAPFYYITDDLDDFPLDNLKGETIGYYLRAMHYVDSAIGEFLHKLKEDDVHENTIIVVYGDHRARLSEDELERVNTYNVSEKMKIPLIIHIPNKRHKGKVDTIGGHVDIAPTICNILGIEVSDRFFMGRDLGHRDRSFAIFRDGSFIANNGFMNETLARQRLNISDLILEKNLASSL